MITIEECNQKIKKAVSFAIIGNIHEGGTEKGIMEIVQENYSVPFVSSSPSTPTCVYCRDHNCRGGQVHCSRCRLSFHNTGFYKEEINEGEKHFQRVPNDNPTGEFTPSCYFLHLETCHEGMCKEIAEKTNNIIY